MSIIRSERRNRYTTISNTVFANNQLSFQAMGMLSYILSKPDNWSVSPAQLITVTKNTAKKTARDGVYAILKELRDTGFILREKLSTGETNYIVYDTPIGNKAFINKEDKKPKSSEYQYDLIEIEQFEPNTENPDADKPNQSEPILIKTDLKQELKSNNKDKQRKVAGGSLLSQFPQELNQQAWTKWLEYKKTIKTSYKTLNGEQVKANRLITLSGGDKSIL
ncbi:hypothetical protein [Photobacterium kishitanii]|uniref:hypothetical protein n=1 Tax=Photobacterium kishitanii TaxID=318456 RepID=UPI00071AF113|nr:hypothetical protein [Photobacterium kishitanii]